MDNRKAIYLLNGPNLNLLGRRNPVIYGIATLRDIENKVWRVAEAAGYRVMAHQSNGEKDLVDWVQEAVDFGGVGILLNAGGLTHTSVSLHDAVEFARDMGVPTIEVHLSDPKNREPFRHHSFIERVSIATFAGEGIRSYEKALAHLFERLEFALPRDRWYRWEPGKVAQCDECGGLGVNGGAELRACDVCGGDGWVGSGNPSARTCHRDECNTRIPPHQLAVYCTNECALKDA